MKELIGIAVVLLLLSAWPVNLYKFVNCDFEPDYKCEAVHGVGVLVPPSSLITMWFGTDE